MKAETADPAHFKRLSRVIVARDKARFCAA
jgi:hypothetical protein